MKNQKIKNQKNKNQKNKNQKNKNQKNKNQKIKIKEIKIKEIKIKIIKIKNNQNQNKTKQKEGVLDQIMLLLTSKSPHIQVISLSLFHFSSFFLFFLSFFFFSFYFSSCLSLITYLKILQNSSLHLLLISQEVACCSLSYLSMSANCRDEMISKNAIEKLSSLLQNTSLVCFSSLSSHNFFFFLSFLPPPLPFIYFLILLSPIPSHIHLPGTLRYICSLYSLRRPTYNRIM
jgi:hypothetical protein